MKGIPVQLQFNFESVSLVSGKAKQEIETCDLNKWKWVEASVWNERMLTALVNGVKGGKWFSLWDKVYAKRTLFSAWKKVLRNRGAAGVDRISIRRFEANADSYLQELERDLKENKYKPDPVKRVYIPKGRNKTRPLGIPTVKDRIVQTALKMVLEPIFEREFVSSSYGFRPNRSSKDALREVDRLLKQGYVWVVDADVKGYFDSISHSRLIDLIKERLCDSSVLSLIELFLKQEIMEGMNLWNPIKGTPQGAVLSPLLANIYLHQLDRMLTSKGYKSIRYADDFVVLCKSEEQAKEALGDIQRWIGQNALELSSEKTHIGNSTEPDQGFEFLGYRFEEGKRNVRSKSLKRFKDSIRAKTRRNRGESIGAIIADLNPSLKGWFEYFKHAHYYTFNSLDGFIRRRLRALLRRQIKKPGFGSSVNDHKRWPNSFFAERGLFTLRLAHLRACQSR